MQGHIEKLDGIEDASQDLIISNCVVRGRGSTEEATTTQLDPTAVYKSTLDGLIRAHPWVIVTGTHPG